MIHSKKVLFNIKLISSHWYSEEDLVTIDKIQRLLVQVVQNKNELISTSMFQVLEKIREQDIDIRSIVKLELK
ncbi:905_t:CDS:1, partial [Scutellospora calospora]